MSIERMAELFLFVIINNYPYLVGLILYPFHDRFRFSTRKTYFIIIIMLFLTFVKECFVDLHSIGPITSTVLTALTTFLLIFGLIKARSGKLLMMLITVMDISIMPLYLGKYTEGLLFYQNSLEQFRWSHTLFIFLWELPLIFGLMKYMNTMVIPVMKRSKETVIWRYLWLVPTTFFVIWNTYLAQFPYYAGASITDRTLSMGIILVISAGSLLIFHVTFMLLNEKIKNETFEAQYKRLQSNIDEARKARHDVRHNLVMIDTYLNDNKIDEVREYLEDYKLSLPKEEALSFCEHYTINAILTYTKQQANMMETDCSIRTIFPSEIPISNQELTIVIGNLLENALDACRHDLEEDPNFKTAIDIKGKYDGEYFLLSVTNTSRHKTKQNADANFESAKRNNGESGIGLQSVDSIVKRHHGKMTIEQEDGLFKVRVLIAE